MLDKIKSFIKQNKDDNILKKQNFKPYFIGSGNEVDLSVLDSCSLVWMRLPSCGFVYMQLGQN